ncbi:MAG: ABC transporter substrate-binding protein [Spirochaetaceae bacterium]|nr:ABC transporter substrate-binding protein [Spirochaetaceae bacterium]
MKKKFIQVAVFFLVVFSFLICIISCKKSNEMSLDEISIATTDGTAALLAKTISKPWQGEEYVPGAVGGVWNSSMIEDPKTFNLIISERDATTSSIMAHMHDYLVDYDYVKKEFVPNCASPEIIVNEEEQTMSVVYTLRDDLYWSFYDSTEKIPVTSDDVIFWYDEIEGDPEFRSSAYNSQFTQLPDGTEKRITIEKIDDKRFAFHFPRIDSNPLLSTNRNFGPKFLFEPAKKQGGVQGVLDLFSVDTDPKKIPSMGPWFLIEYSPGQRLVFARNPDYWRKDSNGVAYPYPETKVAQIVSDPNTQYLLFKEGKQEVYTPRPEELDEVVNLQKQKVGNQTDGWTVFNSEGDLGAPLWSFNQNPIHKDKPFYNWFSKKEFRQGMSCLLNRDRIISQTYRGLGAPKYSFFAEANPFYDSSIFLQYKYDIKKAEELFAKIGMKKNSEGLLVDMQGNLVEFDLTIPSDSTIFSDIATIIMDECAKVGITVNIRNTDFQKIVEQLSSTYDWQSVLIGLGTNYWPTQGSNVWPSDGNLHLWYPLQESPATEWEARIDNLYEQGSSTVDKEAAKKIWDEYQKILLEECPVIYLVTGRSFVAIQNRWDFSNFYYDNIGGANTSFLYLQK